MSTTAYPYLERAPHGPAPLVFAFHGTGGNEHQFDRLIAELLPDAGLIAPRGDVSEHGANRFFRRTGEGVYDMDDLAARTEKMIGFLDAQKARYPDRPVYGLGYSNGANILAAVLFQRPDLFDKSALLHPLIPWTPAPQPGLAGRSVLIAGGMRDPISPAAGTEALRQWFADQDADVAVHLHPGGHEIDHSELTALGRYLTSPVAAAA